MVAESDVEHQRRLAVDHAIDHILDDVTGPLDLAAIAAKVGYSPWHFQRVFSGVMGESPAVFVSRARLERAVAIARAEPNRRWVDIATDAGFVTGAHLSRAFRQRFGRPARSWDRVGPLVDRDRRPGHGPTSPETEAPGGVTVHVERIKGFRFAYRRVCDPYATGNLAAAWYEVEEWRSAIATPCTVLGMSWDDPATVVLEQCRYDLGIALDATTPAPHGATERWMPSSIADVVHVEGDIAAVDAAWEHLHRVWLPSSPYRRSALPSVERFGADPRPSWEQWHLDCIVPIASIA